jgi:3-hydroxyisobutyrate dehydrogenase-like beta-hydroxyacid dehydrogenase
MKAEGGMLMTTLAFCGLGQMGAPMAVRLVEAGHDVSAWNRTTEKVAPVERRGARRADSPAEAAVGAEAAITMVADPPALEAVVLGENGLAEGLAPGSALIDMSTVGPDAVRRIADRLPEGVSVVDAPVLGTVPHAESGELKVFAGGEDRDVERWRPVLEILGTVAHVGPLGAGAAMKLVANSTLGAMMAALGEALALADVLGLNQASVLDILAETPIGATVNRKRASIESGSYPPSFKLSLARKDLALTNDAAGKAGLDLRLAPASGSWLAAAESGGLGGLDYSSVIAHIRGMPAQS